MNTALILAYSCGFVSSPSLSPPQKATLAKISSFDNNPSQTTWPEAKLFFFPTFIQLKYLTVLIHHFQKQEYFPVRFFISKTTQWASTP